MNKDSHGLGLNISRKIISSMGGKIEVQSAIGAGSTFQVVLVTKVYQKEREE